MTLELFCQRRTLKVFKVYKVGNTKVMEIVNVIVKWIVEYTNVNFWFAVLSFLSWYALSSFLGKAGKDKYGLSLRVYDNFLFVTAFVTLALIWGSDVEIALRDEWRQFLEGKITTLGFMAYVLAMFGALAIFNLLLTYVYILISSGIKKIHQWINKL